MVTTVANAAFIAVASLSSQSDAQSSTKLKNVDTRGVRFEANVVTPLLSSSSRIAIKPLLELGPLWNTFFGPMTREFREKTNQSDDDNLFGDSFGSGRLVQNGLVFRQNFPIRSYEIGADGTVSIETIMNHLQETVLNHLKGMGLLGDGLGSTPEMCKRKLIWVTTKVQIVIDRYPTWGDAVQIDDWIVPSGKNQMRRDSHIRDCKTGESLVRASSNWVMMNVETRKLCRIPHEVREEMSSYLMDASPIVENDNKKLPKLDETTAEYSRNGLQPRWSDLDINQYVNNAKYIGWILESVPSAILDNLKLSRITLEYRRECHKNNILQSFSTLSNGSIDGSADTNLVECQHLLRLEDGSEVMKARSEWRHRQGKSVQNHV